MGAASAGKGWDLLGWPKALEEGLSVAEVWGESVSNPLGKLEYINQELLDRLYGADAKVLQCPNFK